MARLKNWEARLDVAIERHRLAPFEWGTSDCFLLPMDAIRAITGTDPYESERGYTTAEEAMRRLVARGFHSVGEAIADVLVEIHPSAAGRGDVVLMASPEQWARPFDFAGGVCVGPRVTAKTERGTAFLERSRIARAFKVG